jgi:hypothetical protein
MVSPNNLRKDRLLASIATSDRKAPDAEFIAAASAMAVPPT